MMCCECDEGVVKVEKVSELYNKISSLESLKPCKDVNILFTQLVLTCGIIPQSESPIAAAAIQQFDITKMSKPVQEMRSNLINLCSQAEGLLEHHFSTIISSYKNPLDNLNIFPYYSNYLKLTHLEFNILKQQQENIFQIHKVAFLGSGPLPFSSIIMASNHLPTTHFHNFDIDPSANSKASALVSSHPDLSNRMFFHTADVMNVTSQLKEFDIVFLAALVGIQNQEKLKIIRHLANYMAPGSFLMLRSAHGARAFLYPVVELSKLQLHGFQILTVFHPTDEVINSVVLARLL